MIISEKYQNECLALRYGLMCQNSDSKIRVEGYKKLIEYCKKSKWANLQDELIRNTKCDSIVSQQIGNLIIDSIVEPQALKGLQELDNFFIRLNPKDAFNNANKICEYALIYFSKGNFSQFNNIFSRYIKNLRDLNNSEMNDFIIKYFISSVIKKNYDNAIMDITTLKNYYQDYDLNIYIYLLKMINGSSITESAESLKNISLNVYEEVWKIVSEEDFAFYAIITLLLNFKRSFLKEIQIVNQSLLNKILEDNSDYYELLEHYTKCKYEDLIENFDKMKLRMANDPLLSKNLMKIIYDFKNNILKEILQATSCIKISKLSLILRENDNYVENWILTGISNGNIKVKIDDVDKIIYSREVSTKNECVRSTNEFSFKTYSNSLKIIMSSISAKNVELKNVKIDDLRKYYFEKSKNDNYDDDYMKMV